jgi:uncharacterized protein YdhG (YjbR/CyaY superfamily)
MANEVETYIHDLAEPTRSRIAEIYASAHEIVPDAVEGLSYGMPALLYRGKGLIAVMSNKSHIGIYPFGNLAELADAVAAAGLESTKGSIHLGDGQRLQSGLLEQLLVRRMHQIDKR